ncbi:MAG: glutamine-hydrolyzing GMP synthase [Clostridia bacterium]|nr:glutamine-hydrolyzing GMP synthase [Clostridia bacterium]
MKETKKQAVKNQTVLVLDFGGQYKELIARRVRECKVHSQILAGSTPIEKIKELDPIGIILTGGPHSVYEEGSPHASKELFELGIPILGICYGMHLMAYTLGGKVKSCSVSEYGTINATLDDMDCVLFKGLNPNAVTLMSHGDRVYTMPRGFKATAHTQDCPIAAMYNESKKLYAVQFHPEVERTKQGKKLLHNFLYKVCKAKGDYTIDDFIQRELVRIREQVGDKQVVLGLSGGVDSSVCAAILEKAIPNQLTCIFVDHGMMRKNEGDEIERAFAGKSLNFVRVNAEERFLSKLEGVSDPERKRKIIGAEFVRVFEEESAKFAGSFLAQGTIYPDVVESGLTTGAVIKSHHNVGGLPKDTKFIGLVEPLRSLFKDEVRELGRKLGLDETLVARQPFPGPGLAVRCIGAITKERLDILRDADYIFREELAKANLNYGQFFAVLTNMRTVGVMGDGRTYNYVLGLRAVITSDFMTCEYAHIPYPVLDVVSSRIVNEVQGVSRVVYDITGKPPATIEWE